MVLPRSVAITLATALSLPAVAQLDVVARDAALRRGTITYRQVLGKGKYSEKVKFTYDSDGNYLERLDKSTRFGPDVKTVILAKGKGWSYMERKQNGTDEVSVGGFLPHNDSAMFFIVEKPSLPLAGGLSQWRDLKQVKVGGNLLVTGKLKDRTLAAATYGNQAARGIPDRIERGEMKLGSLNLFNVFTFSGAIPAGPGMWVPKTIHQTTPHGGTDFDKDITILSADFSGRPKESDLTNDWFHPGVNVHDMRFTPPVEWTYDELLASNGGKPDLDMKALEVLSGKRWDDLRYPRKRTQPNRLPVQIASYLIAAGLMAFAVIRWRRVQSP
jgi:hypothetical protein